MNYVLPGMGATSDMYSGPWRALKTTTFLNWPVHSGAKTIPQLAEELIVLHEIQNGDSMIGTSLGGIVACEIANQLQLKKLTLISSAIHRNEIASLLRIISPLIDLTPLEFLNMSAGKINSELTEMFAQSNPDFIRRMCKAIFKWNGLRSGIKPFRIHGLHDHVIPIPTEIDRQIKGGHLIAMTHAEECVSVIETIH